MWVHFHWFEDLARTYSRDRLREAQEQRLIRLLRSREVKQRPSLIRRAFARLGLGLAAQQRRVGGGVVTCIELPAGRMASCTLTE